MKRSPRPLVALAGVIVIGVCFAAAAAAARQAPAAAAVAYFCPMHPDVTASEPGRCRKCDMTLVEGNPFDTRDYTLDVQASAALVANRPVRLTLTVREPAHGAVVRDFETVHEQRFHLFVVGHDLASFQHVHPVQQGDGSWMVKLEVPAPGYYRLLADFLPSGASPQFVAHTLVTARFDGGADEQAPALQEDWSRAKSVDSIVTDVVIDSGPLVEGEWGHLTFRLRDAVTSMPIEDLEPYLGAFGHMLMVSGDLRDVVHAHPEVGPEVDVSRKAAGPAITFEGYMPRAGLYRAWTQFQRRGTVITVPFTFRVLTLADAVR